MGGPGMMGGVSLFGKEGPREITHITDRLITILVPDQFRYGD
jgi:hypothetical protein